MSLRQAAASLVADLLLQLLNGEPLKETLMSEMKKEWGLPPIW